jgi:hypothetical protein
VATALQLEVVCGFGLFDEDWTLRAAARFSTSYAVAGRFDWRLTRFEAEAVPVDNGDQWVDFGPRRYGPFTATHVGLLRADATPIDAREIEAVVVPAGCRLGDVVCDVRLELL